MSIITVGIDLAKNVFAVHGVDEMGKAVLVKPKVPRDQLAELIAQLPPCLIGTEACAGAHHWARQFRQHGHTVKLMAPKFVAPYRMSGKRGKNDANDAADIVEAVTRTLGSMGEKVSAIGIGGWHVGLKGVDEQLSIRIIRSMRRRIIGTALSTIPAPMRRQTTSTSTAKRRNREPTAHPAADILLVPCARSTKTMPCSTSIIRWRANC